MTNAPRLKKLQDWMLANGIAWDRATVSVSGGSDENTGFAVHAIHDIDEGHALCEIPKDAVLSVRNTAAAEIIETEQLGGGLGLILAIMYELSLGAASKWYGYLQSLPAREYLPIFWRDDELAMLQGTELAGKADADRELTQEDWETHLLPLVTQYPALHQPSMTLDSFRVAASWVASRAFGVDNYHGMAMVPFADLFNHKAAVVQLAGGYFVEDVCMEGVESSSDEEIDHPDDDSDSGDPDDPEACHHGDGNGDGIGDVHASGDEQASTEEEEEGLAENVVQPMTLEAERGGSTRGAMLDPPTQQDPRLRLEIGICGVTKADGTEVLEIIAASKLQARQEIFNTYGEHGNAELINKYGFALPDNPFDSVKLDKSTLVAQAADALGEHNCKRRCAFLNHHSHLLDEDLEPFEVLPNGRINPSLVMGLRVLYASPNTFATWTNLADAVPSMAEPIAEEEAQQTADPRDATGPGDTADAPTGAHASSGPRDCHTSQKSSRKKRISSGDGSWESVKEEEQHSKRLKTCSQSQTDRATVQSCGEVGSQRNNSSGQSGSNGQHSGQDNGQSKGQRNGQSKGPHNGQHRPDGERNAHHSRQSKVNGQSSGQHNGQPENDGQSNGQAEATGIKQPNGSAPPISSVSPHADSESMSDSSLEDEEEEEAADLKLESLGNIDIAAADSQVLSLSMLQGLKTGLQARLSLYATDTTDGDMEQFRKVQEASDRLSSERLSSERLQAQQAALLLRIAEKILLGAAMQAVVRAVSMRK